MSTCATLNGTTSFLTAPVNATDLDIGAGSIVTNTVTARPVQRYVSVGSGDHSDHDKQRMYWSDDGVIWQTESKADLWDSGDWVGLSFGNSVCFGNGMFVAGGASGGWGYGTGKLAYSYDGKHWFPSPSSDFAKPCYSVCFNGTRWVACGGDGWIASSEDGIEWTYRDTLVSTGYYGGAYCVAWTGVNFIVSGNMSCITHSSDGITWNASRQISAFPYTGSNTIIYSVCSNGSVVVASSNQPAGYPNTAYSLDHGITWIENSLGVGAHFVYTIWDGNRFIALSGSNVYSSANGIDWSFCGTNPFITSPRSMCWDGEKIIVVGYGSSTHSYSYDGSDWFNLGSYYGYDPYDHGNGAIGGYGAYGVCCSIAPNTIPPQTGLSSTEEKTMDNQYDFTIDCWVKPQAVLENRYIAVGGSTANKKIMWSSDAINWTQVLNTNVPYSYGYDIAYGNGTYVSVGTHVITSNDGGLNWTSKYYINFDYPNIGSMEFGYGIIYDGSKFIMAGAFSFNVNNYTFDNCFMTSVDGNAWTACGGTIFDSYGACHLAYNGTAYVAVGNGNSHVIATSTNGTDWTGRGAPWYPSYYGGVTAKVCYGEGVFIISRILSWDDQGYCFAHSTDNGLNWTLGGFYNDQWGDPAYMSSCYGIAYNGSIFVAVGVFGYQTTMDWETWETIVVNVGYSIATSPDGINWTGVTDSRANVFSEGRSICYDGTKFVATGNGLQVATSINGTDWTVTATPATAVKTAICCNPAPALYPAVPLYDAPNTKPILCTDDFTSEPSYDNDLLDKSSTVTITTDIVLRYQSWEDYNIDMNQLLYVNPDTNKVAFRSQDRTGKYIMFDFKKARRLTEISLIADTDQGITGADDGWSVLGSNNGTDWTSISNTDSVLEGEPFLNQTANIWSFSGNATGYRYYKLSSASGYITEGNRLYYWRFKIDARHKYLAFYANKTDTNRLPVISVVQRIANDFKTYNYVSKNGVLSYDWQHFVFVKSGIVLKCYINGELSITATYDPFAGVGGWTIGKDWLDNFGKFDMQEMHVWKGLALSETEISHLYNDGNGKFLIQG